MSPRVVPLLLVVAAGCSNDAPPAPPAPVHGSSHEHAHTREHMLLADAGKYHAALTAHLSGKNGNELDIFFETTDGEPTPVALTLASVTAKTTTADGKELTLTFEPAPADERPKDEPAGTCSHFVAKTPWMTADGTITVTAEVMIDGVPRRIVWEKFVPKMFAHHVD